MEVTVKLNYLRIAPRKVRQVANLVRGKKAGEAEAILEFSTNRPAKSVLKLLRSAIAAAKNNFQLESSNLYISKVFANEGPKLKRWRPVARGSAHPLWKRTSHITLILSEVKPTAKKKVYPVKSRPEGSPGGAKQFNRIEKTAQEKEGALTEIIKTETIKEVSAKETGLSKKQDKPRFERKERKLQKTRSAFNRIFRRKAF